MSRLSIQAYPGFEVQARALAAALGCAFTTLDIHTFPDGESRVRVAAPSETVLIYASLNDANVHLVPLLLAAATLRELGAKRLVLLCPYLCYMRQDMAFVPGEAVSQRHIGHLLERYFDRIITVDPHLHRVASLADVLPAIEADALSATGLIAAAIGADPALADAILVGPDGEAAQWVAAVASDLAADYLVATKERHGDRDVRISLPEAGRVCGRTAILVDDVISSGETLRRCAALLYAAGARQVAAYTVHALVSDTDFATLTAAGIAPLCSSDSVNHRTNSFSLTPLLAAALEKER